jgi:hypothetical protein
MSCELLEKNRRGSVQESIEEGPKDVLFREVLLKESRRPDRLKPDTPVPT